MEEKQTNYTIAESYTLPSKGLIYNKDVNEHVELRSMTVREEMKRLSPSKTPYKVLADIIEDCMLVKPAISVYDMCIGDYEYLLHKLRIVTYGAEYKMMVGCPHCGEYVDVTINLDELRVKDFDVNKFKKEASITLPKTGKEVTLKYQTPRTLDSIDAYAEELKKKFNNADLDYKLLARLQYGISTVDGIKLNALDLQDFILKLPTRDANKIIDTLEKINSTIGLDTTIKTTCTKCGGEVLTFFRFGQEFFRPVDN